jgi:antitoxin HicB
MEMAEDALAMILQDHIGKGQPLPRPRKLRGRKLRTIYLPALQSAKVELYMAFKASGMRKAELARRLGIPKANVDRLFDLRHHSRLSQIEAALRVLGKAISVEVRDAA